MRLVIGPLNYSSWSLRPWLALDHAGADFKTHEIARIRDIWRASLSTSQGPYLFGEFSIADCMYMPVLSRFRTYGIGLDGVESAWEHQMWRHPSVVRWVERARESPPVPHYDAFCD